jgi:Lipase (class 3)
MKQVFTLVLACLLVVSQSAYTPSLARELGYFSSIAYESVASINAWNCPKCSKYALQNPKAFSNSTGDIQGFTGYSPNLNAIILAFRGSSNIQNWIINLSFNQVAYSRCGNCKVHNGFQTGYNTVKTAVISQIQALKALHRDAKIYLTGHSLGGALAVLALPDVKDSFGAVAALVTFGQPRVGNSEFASWFGSQVNHERVIHYGDLVPHVPPQANGYLHDGTEIWYDKAMQTYKTCQGDGNGCSNSLPATSLNTGDHSMDIYLTLKVGSSWLQAFDSFLEFMGKLEIKSEKSQNLWTHQE